MIVTDPSLLPALARAAESANGQLRRQLQHIPAREVDALMQPIAARVMEAIDCTTCANCCKTLEPEVAAHEVELLRTRKHMTLEGFRKSHLGYDATRQRHFIKPVCPFLSNNRCTVYAARPQACRQYPRLVPDLKFRWRKTWEDYRVCPIVFNSIELLKESLRPA